jgi:translation initiation factor IF-2
VAPRKLKLFEAAEKFRLSSEALGRIIKELGFKQRGYTSYITQEEFEAVQAKLRDEKQKIKRSMKKTRPARRPPSPSRKPRKPSEEAVQRAIKKTIAKMDHKRSKKKTGRRGRPARKVRRAEEQTKIFVKSKDSLRAAKDATINEFMSVAELAHAFEVPPPEIVKRCVAMGVFVTVNQRLDMDTITILAEEFNVNIRVEKEPAFKKHKELEQTEESLEQKPRPPVVVVLGHVDHGKTTLLDHIRKTRIASQEAGSITQRIGAYTAQVKDFDIVFLDTPGHEAFTAMRARGASVADIAVLVISADDGIKPQTVEAIDHAQAADLPIIVAITKADLATADPDKVKSQLTEHNIVAEDYGGKTIAIPVSGTTGENVDDLLDAIQVTAMELDLKAPYEGRAKGVVIESKLDRSKGSITTIIVNRGTLHRGDPYICGDWSGRVREMTDELGKRLTEATPGTPVQVLGVGGIVEPGESFEIVASERSARELAQKRKLMRRERTLTSSSRLSLETIQEQIKAGNVKDLRIVLKGDVFGSVEALSTSLGGLSIEEVKVRVIHSGVGAITVNDVNLAEASGAIIVGFHVSAHADARTQAKREGIEIRNYKVIYDAIDDIRAAILGMLEPEKKEVTLGSATVRQVFRVSKIGTVAGSYVTEGKVTRDAKVRVFRDNNQLTESEIASLQRFEKSVKEVEAGYECGIQIAEWDDLAEGDTLEFYTIVEQARE